MPICPRCRSQVSFQASVCSTCAAALDTNQPEDYHTKMNTIAKQEVICPSCNKINDPTWAFCGNCGCPIVANQPQTSSLVKSAPVQYPLDQPSVSRKPKPENESFIPLSDLFNNQPQPSTKPPSNSLSDLAFCPVCQQANPPTNEICFSCKSPIARTLPMVSQTKLNPKLRLMHDSGESDVYDIKGDVFTIGRSKGDITFPQDNYMSSCHAKIVFRDQRFFLIDENSKNGVYKRLKEELILKKGDIILIGRQVFKFEE